MKIWLLSSEIMPNICIKAETREGAIEKFKNGFADFGGFDDKSYLRFVKHKTFSCVPLTMELLMEITPDEFALSNDVSF